MDPTIPAWLLSQDTWVGVGEVGTGSYVLMSALKHLRVRVSRRYEGKSWHDHSARWGTLLLGVILGPHVLHVPTLAWQLLLGAVSGWFAVPIYHLVKGSGQLVGKRWEPVEKVVMLLNGPSVGPGAARTDPNLCTTQEMPAIRSTGEVGSVEG